MEKCTDCNTCNRKCLHNSKKEIIRDWAKVLGWPDPGRLPPGPEYEEELDNLREKYKERRRIRTWEAEHKQKMRDPAYRKKYEAREAAHTAKRRAAFARQRERIEQRLKNKQAGEPNPD